MYACTFCDYADDLCEVNHEGENCCPECAYPVREVVRGSQTNLTPTLQKRLLKLTNIQLQKAHFLVSTELFLREEEYQRAIARPQIPEPKDTPWDEWIAGIDALLKESPPDDGRVY